MTSVLTATNWVIGKLKADAGVIALVGTRVYLKRAPAKATYPLVIVTKMNSVDVLGAGSQVIMWNELVLVKAMDKALGDTGVGAVLNAVRGVLHRASGTVAAGTVIGCREEREIPLGDVVDEGVRYAQDGLEFRVWTQ